ncbi:MAG: class I SAM-dependent methyltransferase [Epsilonproteobacteria bacterium]|nr:MAG: class I SAM-dependent methyltransferase [Campylobacterota bacterium]
MNNKKDHFAHKAKDYETVTRRVDNVKNIADGILRSITFDKDMHIMDFGSGTGLLTAHIAPFVSKITCVDMSKSMSDVLRQKKDTYPCELEILELDLSVDAINDKFDSIISSMTIHHIEDTKKLFEKFYTMLNDGGTIALADLETEDGSFHEKDTGVFHFGFNQDEFLQIAKDVGFKDLSINIVSISSKSYGDFPMFLLTGKR